MNTQPSDAGVYTLKLQNDAGEAVCTTSLKIPGYEPKPKPQQQREATKVQQIVQETQMTTIPQQRVSVTSIAKKEKPKIIQGLKPQTQAVLNEVATLGVKVASEVRTVIHWYVNNVEIRPSNKYVVRSQDEYAFLDIKNVQYSDSGTYKMKAVSELGETVESTTLIVKG